MRINLEKNDKNSIQAYSDSELKIADKLYHYSLIVSPEEIISDWEIKNISELTPSCLSILTDLKPKVIIIGHTKTGQFAHPSVMLALAQQGIGLECMSVGAACRTYNVLLSEHREVVLGIIFP